MIQSTKNRKRYICCSNRSRLGLSHRTGEKAVNIFEQMAPNISFVNSTGTVLEFK
ncbi:hypothetical protein [Keratinibaculum paraultunense]|uniref:hypothetical protein n=1 Tax=Keratinibaculum paraultunense TaxID=1278232 RepID=UPI0013048C85|nr:hypothetical protein [Keratinibaculum paraultunense]QQY80071.1 hypothetical protein JL105_01670 [Keratinibaculum paraultunense]